MRWSFVRSDLHRAFLWLSSVASVALCVPVVIAALMMAAMMSACGGGDSSNPSGDGDASAADDTASFRDAGPDVTTTYAVGGNVFGLAGTGLVLDNLGETLSIGGDGPFAFGTRLAKDAPYNVTVRSQPTNPSQTCTVGAGAGTVGSADVTAVVVTCARTTYTIGGVVHGLQGGGLVLRNNGVDDLTVSASGAFTFATPVSSGTPYAVTVAAEPPNQRCIVSGANGTVLSGNVSSVVVNCSGGLYTIGGTITGLAGTLVVENEGADDLTLTANGTFAFATPLAAGQPYLVTVKTQPPSPSQTCVVSGGSGTLPSANVTSVSIACTTNAFTIGGNVSGLSGTLVLENNGGDDLTLSASGAFAFATAVKSGQLYAVTVKTQPGGQRCSVSMSAGTVTASNVTSVVVTCAVSTYTIGGNVSGLAGTVVLRNNGLDDLVVSVNGPFTFATSVASGAAYAVTVFTQPSTQTCTVTPSTASGIVGNANVTSVVVSCVTNKFAVGGVLRGLVSGSVVLRDNGGDDLTLSSNGVFTFATRVASGQPYAVTVATQPSGQTCAVTSGAGTMGGVDVASVLVICRSPGSSVMVLRVGDATVALTAASAPVFLEERSVTDGSLLRTIALPVAAQGANAPFTIAGSATSEGSVSRSSDGRFVTFGGYAAPPATAAVASTAASSVNRVVARVDAAGNVDTSTRSTTAFSGGNVRGATTVDGSAFWMSGSSSASSGGVEYALLGSAGASTQIASSPASTRVVNIFGGQLFMTAASGATYGVLSVGAGTPATAGQIATLLPGFPTSSASPYGFVALDRNALVAGLDTVYVAQDLAPAANTINVEKWTFDGATWTLDATFAPTFAGSALGTRGLAAFVTSAGVRVVATTSETAARLMTFLDDGASTTPAVTALATAGLNTTYRGLAFAP